MKYYKSIKTALGRLSVQGLVPILLLAAGLASCSQSLPEILSVSARLVRIEDETIPDSINTEFLSFFCLVRDDDGIVDLEDLWLIHDEQEIYWHLDSSSWFWIERAGENWIGSHRLAMPRGLSFPTGSWRIILADKGGDRHERSLTLPLLSSRRKIPQIVFSGNNYQLESEWEIHKLVVYNESGSRIAVLDIKNPTGRIRDLRIPEGTKAIALWGEDPDMLNGILSRTQPYTN